MIRTRRPGRVILCAMPNDAARRWGRIAFLVALVPFLLLVWRFDFLCDDAFITFRYARNLAEGEGLCFNPGVEPPVEGYSEFLWALLMAGGMKLGLSPLLLSRVLSVAAGVVLVWITTRLLADRAARTPYATCGAALALGCAPPLAVWATGGMATMPFAAALVGLFAMLWLGERPATFWKLGLLAGAVVLLRADGAWWVLWILGPAIVAGLFARESERWRPALGGAAISVVVLAAFLLWRWSTYDDWLPNTARAKVGLSAAAIGRGGDYLVHVLLTFPGLLLAVAGVLLARRWRERRVGPALVVALITLLHAVMAGGDFMAFGRFLVPALPFVVLLFGAGLATLEKRVGAVGVIVGVICCVATMLPPAFGGALTPLAWRTSFSVRRNQSAPQQRSELDQWRRMVAQMEAWGDIGKALALVSKPGDSISFSAVGAIGYYSHLFVFDRCGLVTREVAMRPTPELLGSPGHDKMVPIHFFADRKPTYLDVFWYPGTVEELRRDPRIRGLNRPLEVLPLDPAESPCPEQLLVIQRGDRPRK